ncbi:hypothetical protein [Leptolyngbya sp. NIES-2104]|uniref:hypothetical protein n=1 Tax=Leptolyngbya sp. NIES-2104 TaxID=1552121 RepID=UPI0006EC4607|nr:hypothetical protein [Leptolyngbya sp. NIES-2104]GAP97910.1 hypothetical protein NIES2104_44630 [Leptolyngbya sp. NIES-2104]
MNRPPEEDEELTSFLRQYRSHPPSASPDLEDRIIQSLPRRSRMSRPIVFLMSGIAASFIGILIAQPVRSPSADPATLEAYLESNWSTVVDGTSDSTSDYFAFVDSTTP